MTTRATSMLLGSGLLLALTGAVAQGQGIQNIIGNVFLQDTTPGVAQIGHANIKGTFRAGQVFVQQGSNGTVPIVGNSTTLSPGNLGGSFSAAGSGGIGVRGTSTNSSGAGVGVYGEDRSANGSGIRGVGTFGVSGIGTIFGAFGLTNAPGGSGVLARNTHPSGPGLIAENTNIHHDAAWLFGNLVIKAGNTLKFTDDNGVPGGDFRYFLLRVGRPDNGDFSGVGQDRVVLESDSSIRGSFSIDSQNRSVLSANIKNFVEQDPSDPGRDIVYACVEGPEAAMYTRGTCRLVHGGAHVALPRHFAVLASHAGMTVTLTPGSIESKGLAAFNKSVDGFDVGELFGGKGDYEFDWEVKAVRKGYESYKVYRPWDERMSSTDNRRAAYETRLREHAQRTVVGP